MIIGVLIVAIESKYRKDDNLFFLQYAEWKDLRTLADALIKDNSGTEQWTGQLKKTIAENIRLDPSSEGYVYRNSWRAIAAEVQLFGGDTIANIARQKGVLYEELLNDVAKKIEANFNKENHSVSQIEEIVLRTLFGDIPTLDKMSYVYKSLEEQGLLGLTSLKSGTFNTVKNGMGKKSKLTTAALLFARLNPVTAAITLPLAVKSLSDPAYRVTIPAVCIIAMMRIKHTPVKPRLTLSKTIYRLAK